MIVFAPVYVDDYENRSIFHERNIFIVTREEENNSTNS